MTSASEGVRGYVAWLARWCRSVLGASLALAGVAATSLFWLEFDVGLVSMLPQGSTRFTDYQRFVERFGAQDLAIALVRGPDRAITRGFAESFAEALKESSEILEVRARVDRDAFLAALASGALPRLLPIGRHPEVRERMEPANVDATVAGMKRALLVPGAVGMRGVLTADPLRLAPILGESLAESRPDRALDPGEDVLSSRDGTRVLLLVRPANGGYGLEAVGRLVDAFARAEGTTRARLGARAERVTVGYTGAFAYAHEDSELLRRDTIFYVALALVGVLAAFFAGYRDLRILPFVTYHLTVTTLLALALGIVLLGRLNLISLAFAAMFYGLGIDAAIHFYTRFLEERPATGSAEEALARTIEALLPPTLIATITTAIAFGVVGFSSLNGVAQLGFLTALGLVLNVPATFVVMAALLLWSEDRGWLGRVRAPTRATWLARVATVVSGHRSWSVPALVALLAAATWTARGGFLDTDLFHLRPAESAARAVTLELQREFGFTDPHGSVLIETVTPRDAEAVDAALSTAEHVTEWLEVEKRSGRVISVTSLSAILPSRATQKARLDAWAKLPLDGAAGRLEQALEREGFQREPFAPALAALRSIPEVADATLTPLPGLEVLIERQLEIDADALSLLVSFTPRDPAALQRVADALVDEVPTPPGVTLRVTGRPLMEAELAETARREVGGFLAFVVGCTGILLFARERRLGPTLALLAVPIASVVGVLGLAAALGIPLTPVSVVVLPLTVGIGLDDCLYLVERYREAGDVTEAVARGGRALSITTATTIAGFGALALSRYPALAGLGALAALSLAICFLVTIAVLPAFLSPQWLRPRTENA